MDKRDTAALADSLDSIATSVEKLAAALSESSPDYEKTAEAVQFGYGKVGGKGVGAGDPLLDFLLND